MNLYKIKIYFMKNGQREAVVFAIPAGKFAGYKALEPPISCDAIVGFTIEEITSKKEMEGDEDV